MNSDEEMSEPIVNNIEFVKIETPDFPQSDEEIINVSYLNIETLSNFDMEETDNQNLSLEDSDDFLKSNSEFETNEEPSQIYRETSAHGPNGFTCLYCDEAPQTLEMLSLHIEDHNINRSFTCKICSKTLQTVNGFNRHTLMHNSNFKPRSRKKSKKKGEKALSLRYKCIECNFSSKHRATLIDHEFVAHKIQTNPTCDSFARRLFYSNRQKESSFKKPTRQHWVS